MQKSKNRARFGFTLIEVLVVVAIIALLVAILLPSLARARDQAQTTSCASNMRQLHYGFTMYAQDNQGRYPGSTHDFGLDWLGYDNENRANPAFGHGRAPEDGVIYKYMSDQAKAYTCPAHAKPRWASEDFWYFSYKSLSIMSGAKAEQVIAGHYPAKNFDTDDHWEDPGHPMEYLDATPLLVEALITFPEQAGITRYENSWWLGNMSLANRHLKSSGRVAVSNVVYTDGHVDGFRLPGLPESIKKKAINEGGSTDFPSNEYFHADALCVQKQSGQWVTMRSGNSNESLFGFIGYAPNSEVGKTYYPKSGNTRDFDPVYHIGQ